MLHRMLERRRICCSLLLRYINIHSAMYYNGYVIICIYIGAYFGFFLFACGSVTLEGPRKYTAVASVEEN